MTSRRSRSTSSWIMAFPNVTRVLDRAVQFRKLPKVMRTDQGPEFTGKAMDKWAYERGVELRLIEAGKPTQNAYVEASMASFATSA